jgi:endonuclease V-like protein UPF0215 family
MHRVHPEKKAIRALGIAESFRKGYSSRAILAGVVMRSDLVIDGIVYGYTTVKGMDATDSIAEMYYKLDRNDIRVIMLGGVVISMFNIIDVDELHRRLNVPVIGLTFEESKGLEEHIRRVFKEEDECSRRLEAYNRLGARSKIVLKTEGHVYARYSGMSIRDVKKIVNKFTLQGSVPEPIRVARLMAKAMLRFGSGPGGL